MIVAYIIIFITLNSMGKNLNSSKRDVRHKIDINYRKTMYP